MQGQRGRHAPWPTSSRIVKILTMPPVSWRGACRWQPAIPKGANKGPPPDAKVPEGYTPSDPAAAAAASSRRKYVQIPQKYAGEETTDVTYTFNVDRNGDAQPDLVYAVRFGAAKLYAAEPGKGREASRDELSAMQIDLAAPKPGGWQQTVYGAGKGAQGGSYKPAPRHWEEFFARTGADRAQHVHVAASLFHDIAPAAALGLHTVWINRLGEGPDPPPDVELKSLDGLAAAIDMLVP